ncbi:pyridoxal-phosphate dependent enzyme, partial [Kitasatospora sp. NPDC058263]
MTPAAQWTPVPVPAAADPHEVPSHWFNLVPSLPGPVPPPREPEGAEHDAWGSRLALQQRIRLDAVRAQDGATEPFLAIPERVREELASIGRPTPLLRARALERYLETPARIYLKREDVLPTGSFKLNSAIAQAHYAAEQGVDTLVTETGAGQWGHAVAWA